MKKKLLAMLFGSALVLGACGGGGENNASEEPAEQPAEEQPAEEQPAEEPAEGTEGEGGAVDTAGAEEVYQQSCASCHGQNLEGGVGPKLADAGSRLSKDDIMSIIQNGQGSMPAGLLQGEDAEKVAAWLAEKK
ncbi:cytochrome c [Bacillus tianshenii]|nr:cytochrome c [Bacillus tianshenii]